MRNIPKKNADTAVATDRAPEASMPVSMPGGAAGVVALENDGTRAALPTNFSHGEKREGEVFAKTYRVKQGGNIMYNGCRTGVRNGKILTSAAFDIAKLVAQGIVLEEIDPVG